jgi:calcium/calmodulin-dependent protein kinase I
LNGYGYSKRKKAYHIGAHLGSGGYGEVKQATALELNNLQVAIKIIPKIHVKDFDEQVRRQDSLAGLKHPHVVHLMEWFE